MLFRSTRARYVPSFRERELTDITYEYPDRIVHLHFFLCNIAEGAPEKKEHNALAWIAPDEVDQYDFCPADKEMLRKTNHIKEVTQGGEY